MWQHRAFAHLPLHVEVYDLVDSVLQTEPALHTAITVAGQAASATATKTPQATRKQKDKS